MNYDKNRTSRFERRQAERHRKREQAATEMALLARTIDKGRGAASTLIFGILDEMSTEAEVTITGHDRVRILRGSTVVIAEDRGTADGSR